MIKKRGIAVIPVESVEMTIIFRSTGWDFGVNISMNSVLNRNITASMVPRWRKIASERASFALMFKNSIMNSMVCPSLLIGSHSTMPCIKPSRIDCIKFMLLSKSFLFLFEFEIARK